MAYTIKRTDGTTLLTLSDSRVDQLTTSLTLIGKNVDSYGEYYNDNLVGLLENFASLEQPRSPLVGQLWYNKVDGRMYVYGLDNLFKPVAATQVSNVQPTNVNQGDLWIDTVKKQLWFTPDGSTFTLAGPQYSTTSGKSGWLVETIIDTGKTEQVVAALYNKDQLLGIASSAAFVFDVPYNGMSSVQIGFNLNQSIPGIRFIGTATSADSVQGFTPDEYLKNIGDQVLQGGFSVLNDLPGLYVGGSQDVQLYMDSQFANLVHNVTDKSFRLRGVTSGAGSSAYFTALTVKSDVGYVGILTEQPQYPLDVYGNTRIQGDLLVEGAATYIQSTNLQVTDKNIELAHGNLADSTADGGGITLKGATDHTILWKNDGTGWNFAESVNISDPDIGYKIDGNTVILAGSLGTVIEEAPGMKRMGVLEHLTVTNVLIHSDTVQTTGSNITLHLSATGAGTVDVTNHRLSSVATPIYGQDATNKTYVDTGLSLVGTKGFTVSIDITNMNDPDVEIVPYLDKLLPISNPGFEYLNLSIGTRVRVLCSSITYHIPASPPQLINLNYATSQVKDLSNNTQTVILQGLSGTIPATTQIIPTVTQVVRQYSVSPILVWQYDGIIT